MRKYEVRIEKNRAAFSTVNMVFILLLCMQFAAIVFSEGDGIKHLQPNRFPDFCEEFMSQPQWDRLTAKYCDQFTYHNQNQRKDGECGIRACLPPTTCPPGEIPILYEDDKGAYIKCQPCPDEFTFEPFPRISYLYRDPTCSRRHQRCWESKGKVLVTAGDAAHDTRCRCLWEKGFSPLTTTPHCASPEGFGDQDECYCHLHKCPDHTQLNEDFDCVSHSTTEDPPKSDFSTTKDPQTMATSQSTPPKAVDPSEEDSTKPESDVQWKIYLAALVLALLIPAIFIMCNLHP